LPLVAPHGCSLPPEGLESQRRRALHLGQVAGVAVAPQELRVLFGADVDRDALDELIATERDCCSFVDVTYDPAARELRIASGDERGREVVGLFAAAFSGEGSR
jgi:hypothetical protein